MKRIKYIILSILAIGLATAGINEYMNRHVRVTSYIHYSSDLPEEFDGYRVLVISDIHNAPFDGQITDTARREKPDIIVFCGDIVQLPDDETTAARNIGDALGEDIKLYAVSGNHEMQNYGRDAIFAELSEHNITVIDDESIRIKKDGAEIVLAGLKDPKDDYLTTQQLNRARKKAESFFEDTDEFGILLNHRADMYPEIKGCGADLIISGHLHGGVVRLPFIGGVFGKDENTDERYEYGFYGGDGDADMIVSGGCDMNNKKKRIFNPPEVVMITLRSEEDE